MSDMCHHCMMDCTGNQPSICLNLRYYIAGRGKPSLQQITVSLCSHAHGNCLYNFPSKKPVRIIPELPSEHLKSSPSKPKRSFDWFSRSLPALTVITSMMYEYIYILSFPLWFSRLLLAHEFHQTPIFQYISVLEAHHCSIGILSGRTLLWWETRCLRLSASENNAELCILWFALYTTSINSYSMNVRIYARWSLSIYV